MRFARINCVFLTCICIAVAASLAIATPNTEAANPCKADNARMLRSNADSFVFHLRERADDGFHDSHRAGFYACNARVGRWHQLMRSSRWTVDAVHLTGDMTAYTIAKSPIVPGGDWPWILRAMNTRTGRLVHNVDFTGKAFITDFVVGRSGSLAYVSYDLRRGDWYYWVKRRTVFGVETLDKGRKIAEFSLEQRGARISWKNGGRRVRSTIF